METSEEETQNLAEQALAWVSDTVWPLLMNIWDAVGPLWATAIALLIAIVAAWNLGVDFVGMVKSIAGFFRSLMPGFVKPKTAEEKADDGFADTKETLARLEAKLDAQLKAQEKTSAVPEDASEKAMAAIAAVFATNDSDMDGAKKAFRDGDVEAAERAIASAYEKEVRIADQGDQARVKAAGSARNMAAIVATRSVVEAIEWYEKAATQDPSHFWTHIELARLFQAKGDLAAAQNAAQCAMGAAEDDHDRSVARDGIGDVLLRQSDLAGALENYRAGMAIMEKLAKADPGRAEWQRDLSVSHEKVGDVLAAMGDLAGAIASYEQSLPIAQDLADRFPYHPQFHSDLEETKRRLAELGTKRDAQGD